jgi:hypothetical protein
MFLMDRSPLRRACKSNGVHSAQSLGHAITLMEDVGHYGRPSEVLKRFDSKPPNGQRAFINLAQTV